MGDEAGMIKINSGLPKLVMVFNATFNNISVIWWSVLLVEETRVPWENHWPVASHWQTLSHNVLLSTPRHKWGFELTTLVGISTDCTGSCKSNQYTITTTTALIWIWKIRSDYSWYSTRILHCDQCGQKLFMIQMIFKWIDHWGMKGGIMINRGLLRRYMLNISKSSSLKLMGQIKPKRYWHGT